MSEQMNDNINHPKHYADEKAPCECIDVIKYITNKCNDGFEAYCIGNVIKYLWRAGIKADNACEDYGKAKWYLDYVCNRYRNERP